MHNQPDEPDEFVLSIPAGPLYLFAQVKVAIPLVSLKSHGGVRLLVYIANYLGERGMDVVLFVPEGRVDTPFRIKVDVEEMPIREYISRMRRFQPDAVIYNFFLTAYLFPFFRKSRGVYFVQDYEPNFFSFYHPFRYLARLTYSFPLKKIATTRWLMRRVGAEDFVYPGVDTDVFTFRPKGQFDGRILMFPRRHPHKGLDRILEIAPVLKSRGYELIFATRDSSLKPLLREYGRVVSPRSDEELVSLYHDADVLLYTTRMEAFGLPLFEAMATGTPFITSHYPVLDELIPDDMRQLVLRDFKIQAVMNTLERLKDEDYRRHVVMRGRKLVEEKFTLQSFLNGFEEKALT